jgi:hypothetical protein
LDKFNARRIEEWAQGIKVPEFGIFVSLLKRALTLHVWDMGVSGSKLKARAKVRTNIGRVENEILSSRYYGRLSRGTAVRGMRFNRETKLTSKVSRVLRESYARKEA